MDAKYIRTESRTYFERLTTGVIMIKCGTRAEQSERLLSLSTEICKLYNHSIVFRDYAESDAWCPMPNLPS